MAAASAARATVPHATPIPTFAPTLSAAPLVKPELWTLVASVSSVLVVVADAGAVVTEVNTSEVCAAEPFVAALVFGVSETNALGKLVITLPGGSEKTSETPAQSQSPPVGHPAPHSPIPWQQKCPPPQLTTPNPVSAHVSIVCRINMMV